MSAWTTVTLDHYRDGRKILELGVTPNDNLKYWVCKSGWWDYVIEVGKYISYTTVLVQLTVRSESS